MSYPAIVLASLRGVSAPSRPAECYTALSLWRTNSGVWVSAFCVWVAVVTVWWLMGTCCHLTGCASNLTVSWLQMNYTQLWAESGTQSLNLRTEQYRRKYFKCQMQFAVKIIAHIFGTWYGTYCAGGSRIMWDVPVADRLRWSRVRTELSPFGKHAQLLVRFVLHISIFYICNRREWRAINMHTYIIHYTQYRNGNEYS
jgi:hypothetical protein